MATATDIRQAATSEAHANTGEHVKHDVESHPHPGAAGGPRPRRRGFGDPALFLSVYLAAFHAPRPRNLPVAGVGTPQSGYSHLLDGKGKKAAVIYTSAVWEPGLGSAFESNLQSTCFDALLRWTAITDITQIRYQPTRNGSTERDRRGAHTTARERGGTF